VVYIINVIKIDNSSYPLNKENYYDKVSSKKQIVIGHSFTDDMTHYIGWKTRYNGKYKKNSSFTIDVDGKIYQHYNPKYYSDFLNIEGVDEGVIGVTLINKGWLMKNMKTNMFFDYLNRPVLNIDVVNKKWRGHNYWSPYSKEQIESLTKLCRYLSKNYGVELQTLGHNTKTNGVYDYNGIVFRSNYMKEYTDLSPAFDFVEFKNKLKKK